MLSDQSTRGEHGFRTTDKPCPECGKPGHEVALVLGVRAILCPSIGFGEIKPVQLEDVRCPDCRTPVGARHYCGKAPEFFVPAASDERRAE